MNSAQAAGAGITYFPLWNLGITTSNYEMYTPGTDIPSNTSHQSQAKAYFDATGATRPGSVSRLCLSCHDGAIAIDTEGCTLCLACVGACPTGALQDNPDMPQLRFQEDACIQCGLCRNTCPSRASGMCAPCVQFPLLTTTARRSADS